MSLKCLTIDDEPLAHTILENYIGQVSSLQLVGKCYNAVEAINFLHQNPVELIFLDIQMPLLTGLEMLKTLQNPPHVILTTAYSEFALESYEFGVSDYLLKPIRFERFLKAVNKILQRESKESKTVETPALPTDAYILVKQDGTMHKIALADILYVEGYGNFVKIHVADKYILVAETMTDIQTRLPAFLRIHKSYLLNINALDKIEGNRIFLHNKQELPLGNSFKQAVLEKLKNAM
ncbi:MAG: DNA-binding response regulator [Bacteroidetes bacterium]|nr:MAG: DNA-binding response regulator [Bacteroidota bacterium]